MLMTGESAGAAEVLASVAQIIDGPASELLERLSAATAELIPHRAVAQLASQCASTPVTAHGEPALAEAITGADLAALLGTVTAGQPWQGVVPIAGESARMNAAVIRIGWDRPAAKKARAMRE